MTFSISTKIDTLPTSTQTAVLNFADQCLSAIQSQYSLNLRRKVNDLKFLLEDYLPFKQVAYDKFQINVGIDFETKTSVQLQVLPEPQDFCGPLSKIQRLQNELKFLPDSKSYNEELARYNLLGSLTSQSRSGNPISRQNPNRQYIMNLVNDRTNRKDIVSSRIHEKYVNHMAQIKETYIHHGYHQATQKMLELVYERCEFTKRSYQVAKNILITLPEEKIDPGHEELIFTMKFL